MYSQLQIFRKLSGSIRVKKNSIKEEMKIMNINYFKMIWYHGKENVKLHMQVAVVIH